MPGLYLLAILVSAGCLALLDARFRWAFWSAPLQTAVAVGTGTAFFLAWDVVGIATGVFVKGDSPLYVGWEVAPHLPVEEVVFLGFLCYLAVLIFSAVRQVQDRRRRSDP